MKITRRKDGLLQAAMTINGKRTYFYGHTKREIEKKILAYQEQKTNGRTFRQAARLWEQGHLEEVAYGTRESYKTPLKRAVVAFGDTLLQDIRPIDIRRMLQQMATQGYSQHTAAIQLSTLRQIFNADRLSPEPSIDVNPCDGVPLPKGMNSYPRRLPDDGEIEKIKLGLSLPFGLFPFLCLYTGCRRGEALALQWQDIDWNEGLIHITKSVYYIGGSPHLKEPKTKSGTRTVPLLAPLRFALFPYKQEAKESDYIFGGETLLTEGEFRGLWKRYCRAAGLVTVKEQVDAVTREPVQQEVNAITPHQLRHAYATILFEAGIPEKDAQELLGHSKIAVTRDVYTHIRKERRRETYEQLDEFVSTPRPAHGKQA